MKIIVGLGNPGTKYEFTRHNAGFLMVDFYASENNFEIKKLKHKALTFETVISGEKVIFVKPQTFMNLSGDSVREIAEYYGVSMDDVLVIYDDISLPLGKIRMRKKGSAGGHNGIKDIILKTGTDVFPRLKIGVSENNNIELVDYVLGSFSKKEPGATGAGGPPGPPGTPHPVEERAGRPVVSAWWSCRHRCLPAGPGIRPAAGKGTSPAPRQRTFAHSETIAPAHSERVRRYIGGREWEGGAREGVGPQNPPASPVPPGR